VDFLKIHDRGFLICRMKLLRATPRVALASVFVERSFFTERDDKRVGRATGATGDWACQVRSEVGTVNALGTAMVKSKLICVNNTLTKLQIVPVSAVIFFLRGIELSVRLKYLLRRLCL
jgi:hypothetical protein